MYKGKKLRVLAAAIAFCMASGNVVSAPVQYAYAAETVTMSETEKNIVAGDRFQLKVNGIGSERATYSWSSKDPSIATVNARGMVTGVALGTTTVSCKVTKADKSTVTVTCFVTVRTRVPSTGVAISNANYQISNAHVMKVGEVFDFDADIVPAQSTDKVYWEIADNSYAIVAAGGEVTALKPGITRLIVYAGKDESSARAETNRVVDEIYIYITGTSTEGPSVPTPTEPPFIMGGTPTPVPTMPPTTPAEPASGRAEVDKVSLVSANTLEIKFGKPVLESYVLNADRTLKGYVAIAASSGSSSFGKLTGALSADGTTLTVTATGKFDGTYVVMVASGILTTSGDTIARYVQTLKLKDEAGPAYLGTEVDSKGYVNTIKFSEEIDISALSIVAVATDCDPVTSAVLMDSDNYILSEDKTSLMIDLAQIDSADENKELLIGINGITDTYGNRTSPSILTVTLKSNTELRAPGQIVSVERSGMDTVQVTFDSPLFDAGSIIVGGRKFSGIVSEENECAGIYLLDETASALTGKQLVGVTGWYSYYAYGAVYNTVSKVVDFSVPAGSPLLIDKKLLTKNDGSAVKLELTYNRMVEMNELAGSFYVSYRAANGDITPMNVTYIGSTTGNKAVLEIYSNAMNGSGTYTITLPAGLIRDRFDKLSTGTTFVVTLEAEESGKLDEPVSIEQDTENASVIYVKFGNRVDERTATDISNYVLANYMNPLRAELIEQGAAGATIKLTFAEGTIPYDTEYPIKISGIRGYGSEAAVMDDYETELTLAENVAPMYASGYFESNCEIVLTFFESTVLSGTPEFDVYYAGKNVALFSYLGGDNTVRIYLNADISNGIVTIVPTTACNITDASGNAAVLDTSYTITR